MKPIHRRGSPLTNETLHSIDRFWKGCHYLFPILCWKWRKHKIRKIFIFRRTSDPDFYAREFFCAKA